MDRISRIRMLYAEKSVVTADVYSKYVSSRRLRFHIRRAALANLASPPHNYRVSSGNETVLVDTRVYMAAYRAYKHYNIIQQRYDTLLPGRAGCRKMSDSHTSDPVVE